MSYFFADVWLFAHYLCCEYIARAIPPSLRDTSLYTREALEFEIGDTSLYTREVLEFEIGDTSLCIREVLEFDIYISYTYIQMKG